jgi:DNA-binding XRE family transcriptional regulator
VNRPKAPTAKQIAEQRAIADDWMNFRSKHLLSQDDFAKILGISRRTVQYVEHGNKKRPEWLCMPLPNTVAKFDRLKRKFEQEAVNQ